MDNEESKHNCFKEKIHVLVYDASRNAVFCACGNEAKGVITIKSLSLFM